MRTAMKFRVILRIIYTKSQLLLAHFQPRHRLSVCGVSVCECPAEVHIWSAANDVCQPSVLSVIAATQLFFPATTKTTLTHSLIPRLPWQLCSPANAQSYLRSGPTANSIRPCARTFTFLCFRSLSVRCYYTTT